MNEIIIKNQYVEILLNELGTHRAIVSVCDLEMISKYRWCLSEHGYCYAKVDGKQIYMHRLIMNAKQDEIIDHITRNKLDNRRSNLRSCTKSQNSINKKLPCNNKSGYVGVSYRNDRNRWIANIKVNKKTIRLGSYNSKEEAISARKEAEMKYFGEFVPRNERDED